MLGSFASGLFGGIQAAMEIRGKVEELRQQKLLNEAAEAAAKALKEDGDQNQASGASMPQVKDAGAPTPLMSPSSLLDDPDLKTIEPPKYMSGAMKSATAADAARAVTETPKYLPPAKDTGAKAAFDAATGMEPVQPAQQPQGAASAFDASDSMGRQYPGGALGFSFTQGLHPTKPGEPGILDRMQAPLSNVGFSLTRGLHPAQEGTPAGPSAPVYLPQQVTQPVKNQQRPTSALDFIEAPARKEDLYGW